jgi:hypothetical protein
LAVDPGGENISTAYQDLPLASTTYGFFICVYIENKGESSSYLYVLATSLDDVEKYPSCFTVCLTSL